MAAVPVDLECLSELIDASPDLRLHPQTAPSEPDLERAKTVVGTLPPSYRWWLLAGGLGTIDGEPIASVLPIAHRGSDPDVTGLDEITEPWRRGGGLLCLHTDAEGVAHCFVRDHTAQRPDGEQAVMHVDAEGNREPFADTFAGFLTVHDARRRGLGDGPVPAVARLWRSTPGLMREDGLTLYGPHSIVERNTTYEVAEYAPEWVMVGDDSGGSGLFIRRHGRDRSSVWRLGMGAICPEVEEIGTLVTTDLIGWLATGAPLPE